MKTSASKNALFKDHSLWVLIFSNLVTIFIAFHQGWNLSETMLVYWFQSVIIGFFNFIRILDLSGFSIKEFLINKQPIKQAIAADVFLAFFFLAHYGTFHFVYLFALFRPHLLSKELLIGILPAIAIFFVNHFFSYIYNRPRDNKRQNIGILLFYPYARIIPMHFTTFIGSMLINSFAGAPLFVFLALKTLADVMMHTTERILRS